MGAVVEVVSSKPQICGQGNRSHVENGRYVSIISKVMQLFLHFVQLVVKMPFELEHIGPLARFVDLYDYI